MEVTSREHILKKIRQALTTKTNQRFPAIDLDKNIYAQGELSKEEEFAKSFTKVGGQFNFCENELDFIEKIIYLAEEHKWDHFYCTEKHITGFMDRVAFPYMKDNSSYPEGMVSITTCEALISRLGSVLVSSRQGSGRRLFVVPTVHIILAYTSQVVTELKEGLQMIKNKYGDQMPSMIAALTGPSRTADIEKTLVSPAHGPRDIYVFLIDG